MSIEEIPARRASEVAEAAPQPLDRTSVKGLIFTIAYAGIFLVWLLFGGASKTTRILVSDLVGPLTAFAGCAWSLWGSRTVGKEEKTRRATLAPNLLTLGLGSYAIAECVWSFCELQLHQAPFPSLADVGYVAAAGLFLAGLVVSPTRPIPSVLRWRVLLDCLMTMVVVVTFGWYFALGPAILGAKGSLLAKILSSAYPTMDLAMLFCVLVLCAHPLEKGSRGARGLLCAGIVSYVIADVGFAYASMKGGYETGTIDVAWVVANLMIGHGIFRLRRAPAPAAAVVDDRLPIAARNPFIWRALLPYGLVPAIGALLYSVWLEGIDGQLATGVYAGSATLVFLLLVRQVLAIVENARIYRYLQQAYLELEAVATIDGMTGLPNHRTFQEKLRQILGKANEAKQPVALLMIDVDWFKQYNDSFGHPAGDEALRVVARLIKESVRTTDVAARYGGEEFAVILPGIEVAGALVVAERIRAAVEAEAFPLRTMTLSIGLTSGIGAEPGAAIELADRALYCAKHNGRNQVAVEPNEPVLRLVQGDGAWQDAA